MCIDIKNFYLGNPMKYFQYMPIHKKIIPQEVLDEYNIIFNDQYFTYVEIRRGMYGLKESGVITFYQLVQKPKRFGYDLMPQTPRLWRHTSRKTTFTLCVNNFGIQYFSKADVEQLIDAIRDTYECSINCVPLQLIEHSYVSWMASINWLASAFEKYWMPKLSTQSVKVVLREVCLQSPGVWGMGS